MSEFTDFIEAYDKFLTDKKLVITSHDAEQYGFKVGVTARELFRKHVDQLPDDLGFSEEVKERFKNMFNEGRLMLGVHVMSNPMGKDARKVYLYKVNVANLKTVIKDVVFKKNTKLFTKQIMKDPMGGSRYWRYGIKSASLRIKDSVNVYIDSAEREENGTFVGEEKGVSVSGTVNYETGDISINRISNINNSTAIRFESEYNEFIDKKLESSSGSGGGKSGGSSPQGGTVGSKFNKKHFYYDKDTFHINFIGFVEPMIILWEYEIPEVEKVAD
jgi:hypothetical protein